MKICICTPLKYAIGTILLIGFLFNSAAAVVTSQSRISVGSMYTDNVDLTPDNEEYDFVTTVSPAIDLNMTEPFSSFSVFYSPTYASYLRFPEYNTLRHNASIDASRQITRMTRLEFSNSYLYTEDPLAREDEPDADTTVRQGREPYTMNTTALGIINQFGPEDSVTLEYEYYFLHNSDSTIEDNDHHHPSITMNYWPIPNQFGSETELSYTKRNYDESENYNDIRGRLRLIRRIGPHFEVYAEYSQEQTDYESDGEDYKVFSPLVGFVWDEYVNYSLSASFGYFFRKNDYSGTDSGPLGTINGHYAWEHGTALSITGSVGYDRASGGAENLGFNPYYDVEGTAEYPVTQRLNSNLFVGYRWNIYIDEDPDRDDTIWRAGAGLTYQVSPWMIVDMNYFFRKLNSNINTEEYVENRAEIVVTLTPRQPLRLLD